MKVINLDFLFSVGRLEDCHLYVIILALSVFYIFYSIDFVGTPVEFNATWLCGGHPLLNVGDLSIEASQQLGLLLDQLRFPIVKSLTNSVIVVLINRYAVYSLVCQLQLISWHLVHQDIWNLYL